MATLAELQAELDALRRIRNAGTARVRTEDREVTYRTDSELAAAMQSLEAQIAAQQATSVRSVRFVSTKGL